MIAITDHILRKNDVLAKAARVATFGRRRFSVLESSFSEYLGEIAEEAQRAKRLSACVAAGRGDHQDHVTREEERSYHRSGNP